MLCRKEIWAGKPPPGSFLKSPGLRFHLPSPTESDMYRMPRGGGGRKAREPRKAQPEPLILTKPKFPYSHWE